MNNDNRYAPNFQNTTNVPATAFDDLPENDPIRVFCQKQAKMKMCMPVLYNKIVTGGNDPQVTQAQLYAHAVRSRKHRTIYPYRNGGNTAILANVPVISNSNIITSGNW
jgi:hypothetical protein